MYLYNNIRIKIPKFIFKYLITNIYDENNNKIFTLRNFGGSTIFFNSTGVEVKSKVEYMPNRAVIFLHTPYSFHGVDRLKDNGDIKRKTLYIDYYSESLTPFKYMELPFKNHWFKHGTTFILPKLSDYLKSKNRNYAKTYIKYLFGKAVS